MHFCAEEANVLLAAIPQVHHACCCTHHAWCRFKRWLGKLVWRLG